MAGQAPLALLHQSPSDEGSDEDEILVAAALLDRSAFAPLYCRYIGPVFAYCYRRLGTKESAEDATAQIFTRALAALPTHRAGGPTFRSWLFAIAHNTLVNIERARRPVDVLDQGKAVVDPALSPEGVALAAEERQEVLTLLLAVPVEQRRVLQLRLAGLSTDEIASALGTSPGAVRVSQCRALKRLRVFLGVVPHGTKGHVDEPYH